jgi:hypothetical protein
MVAQEREMSAVLDHSVALATCRKRELSGLIGNEVQVEFPGILGLQVPAAYLD